jgi:hypothetical protein
MRILLAAVCLLVACSPGTDKNGDGIVDGVRSPDSVSEIAPSTPIGTLSGQTLNTDFTPLDGVAVTAIVGGATAPDGTAFKTTSKADGSFALTGLPAGAQVQVTLEKALYATLHVSATVPAAAGMFPINNGNANVGVIAMTQLSDNLSFQVLTADGHPATGAVGMIEVSPAGTRVTDISTYGAGVGVVVINSDGTGADTSGMISFKNVPGLKEETRLAGTYIVTIAALDTNGDKIPDFEGTRKLFTASDLYLGVASHVLTLPSANVTTAVQIIASNVDSAITGAASAPLKNMVKPGDALFFVFDQPVLENEIELKITDELGTTQVMDTHTLSPMTNNVLQVMPAMIEQGKEYNLAMRVVGVNGTVLTRTAYYFGGDPAAPMMFAIQKISYIKQGMNMAAQPQPGDVMVVTFNQPIQNTGGVAADVVFAQDINLNGNNTDPGEAGDTRDASPFRIIADEPIAESGSTFANLASGYTTRYVFALTNPPATASIALSTAVTVRFSRDIATLAEYRTIWDAPIEADATIMMISQP